VSIHQLEQHMQENFNAICAVLTFLSGLNSTCILYNIDEEVFKLFTKMCLFKLAKKLFYKNKEKYFEKNPIKKPIKIHKLNVLM
jgi:hypothetical protein